MNSDSIPNLRRLQFPISDACVNQQTESATVTSAAYTVTSNETAVRWSERSREPTRKRKLGDDHTTPVSTRGYGQAGSAQERTYRLFETHNPDLDERPIWLTVKKKGTGEDRYNVTERITETEEQHRKRWAGNRIIKMKLQQGHTVKFNYQGSSLEPYMGAEYCLEFEPVVDHGQLSEGDIVFCEVQPGNKMLAQKILHIGDWHQTGCISPKRYFYIGRKADPPGRHGYCYDEHIYGRMSEAQ